MMFWVIADNESKHNMSTKCTLKSHQLDSNLDKFSMCPLPNSNAKRTQRVDTQMRTFSKYFILRFMYVLGSTSLRGTRSKPLEKGWDFWWAGSVLKGQSLNQWHSSNYHNQWFWRGKQTWHICKLYIEKPSSRQVLE